MKNQSDTSYDPDYDSLQGESSSSIRTSEERKSLRRLSQIPGINQEEAEDMSKWSSEHRQAELKRLKDQAAMFQVLMLMVSMNSGWYVYTQTFQLFYCKSVLNMTAPQLSAFQSNILLPWLVKPLWGFFSDSFRFFGYRFKSHIMMATVVSMVAAGWMVVDPRPNTTSFTLSNLLLSLSVAYVDTMAEGMTAITSKIYERIKVLEELENGEKDGDDDSMTAFGIFNAIRSLFQAVMSFVGGILAKKFGNSTFWSGVILGVFPVILFLYILLTFKEEKKSRFFSGCKQFIFGLKTTVKATFMPTILLPLLYIILPGLQPSPSIYIFYLVVGEGGWTFEEWNLVSFISAALMSVFLMSFINLAKNWSFTTVQIWAQILLSVSMIAMTAVLWCRYFSVIEFSILIFFINFVSAFAANIQVTSIIGRISKYLPEGFESTGITIILSASNGMSIFSGYANKWFFPLFNVKAGYYDTRLRTPFIITDASAIFWVLAGPLFLMLG